MPPITYVNFLRIKAAVNLLQQHCLFISEVALTVGFSDASYFSRLFKKYKKISPTNISKDDLTKQCKEVTATVSLVCIRCPSFGGQLLKVLKIVNAGLNLTSR